MQRLVSFVVAAAAVLSAESAHAQAQIGNLPNLPDITIQQTWRCTRGDGKPCTVNDLSDQQSRQILILPTGYTDVDRDLFWGDYERFVATVSNTGAVWSTERRDRIIYIGCFLAGGPLGQPGANFGAKVLAHPIRDFALTLSLEEVASVVAALQATQLPALKPMAVQVLFNDETADITGNASPPRFVAGSYGVAKVNRHDLDNGYIATHELAHASLNFVDEYTEQGLENTNIRAFDIASPLLELGGSWSPGVQAIADLFDVYDVNISEILANNGNDNVATSTNPSTVYSPISSPTSFPYEGGMLFGRGVFHAAGKNLMNSDRNSKAADDGFAYAHSPGQEQLINNAFGGAAPRANDRLRTAGPKDGWPLALGSTTTVMLFDGDKNHEFHKTQSYLVQVGWYERVWATCYAGFIPYPCPRIEWKTAQKTIYPTKRTVQLQATSLYGLANLAQDVFCGIGYTETTNPDGTTFQLCERPLSDIASAFLPTFTFSTPYTDVTVPASQWFTTYWWRFASYNGTTWSGYTGWSSFYRSF